MLCFSILSCSWDPCIKENLFIWLYKKTLLKGEHPQMEKGYYSVMYKEKHQSLKKMSHGLQFLATNYQGPNPLEINYINAMTLSLTTSSPWVSKHYQVVPYHHTKSRGPFDQTPSSCIVTVLTCQVICLHVLTFMMGGVDKWTLN